MGAVFAAVLLYPLDVAKTRRQADVADKEEDSAKAVTTVAPAKKSYNMWLACWLIYRREGVGGLFAGLSSKVVHTLASNFAYFYWYSFLKQSVERRSGAAISTGMNLFVASLAGALNMSMTLPLEMINTRAQIQPSDSESSSESEEEKSEQSASSAVKNAAKNGGVRHQTMWEIAREIYAEDGLLSFWKGFIPSLVLVSNPSINFTIFDKLKLRLQQSKMAASNATRLASLTAWEAFVLAAVAKAVATIVTYPVIRAKVLMQAQKKQLASQSAAAPAVETHPTHPHHPHHHHHPSEMGTSMVQVLQRIGELEGPTGYFKGCSAQLFNTVLKSALLLMTKEQITKYTMRVLYALRRDDGPRAIAAAKA